MLMDFANPLFERLQDSWQPVSRVDLAALEVQLGLALPEDHREFLLRYNGGAWRHGVQCKVRAPSWCVDEIIVHSIHGIVPDSRFGASDIRQDFEAFRDRIPAGGVPIMNAAGDPIFLDLGPANYGKVYYYNRSHEGDEENLVYLISDSFAEFIQALQPTPIENVSESLPAFQAVEQGQAHLVREFLADGGKVDLRNAAGWTLATCAARNSWPRILELLLEAGADPNARDRKRWCPAHHAIWACSLDCTKLLLAAGADVGYRDADCKNLAQIARSMYRFRLCYFLEPLMK
jgi:hypothetical protein